MVLGETCKISATSADRKKVAALGAGRGDWCCIGTSLDALGAGGASPPPAPTGSATAGSEVSSPARHPYRNVATRVYAGTPVRPPTASTDPVADLGGLGAVRPRQPYSLVRVGVGKGQAWRQPSPPPAG